MGIGRRDRPAFQRPIGLQVGQRFRRRAVLGDDDQHRSSNALSCQLASAQLVDFVFPSAEVTVVVFSTSALLASKRSRPRSSPCLRRPSACSTFCSSNAPLPSRSDLAGLGEAVGRHRRDGTARERSVRLVSLDRVGRQTVCRNRHRLLAIDCAIAIDIGRRLAGLAVGTDRCGRLCDQAGVCGGDGIGLCDRTIAVERLGRQRAAFEGAVAVWRRRRPRTCRPLALVTVLVWPERVLLALFVVTVCVREPSAPSTVVSCTVISKVLSALRSLLGQDRKTVAACLDGAPAEQTAIAGFDIMVVGPATVGAKVT